MRPPAQIAPWMSLEEMSVWVREAPDKESYRRRLAIWITSTARYDARTVAELLQVSTQAVWLWVGQYNQQGPEGLRRQGRGGRRWAFLTEAEEAHLLEGFIERAGQGEVLTAKQMLKEVRQAVGREVSLHYIYRLLRRHDWRKIGPRPRHVKANRQQQEEFKKKVPAHRG